MSAHIHDVIIGACAAALVLGLLPSVLQATVIPKSMCAVNGAGLFALAVNYATMRYFYSAATEFADVTAWAFLLAVAHTTTAHQDRARQWRTIATATALAAAALVVWLSLFSGLDRVLPSQAHDLCAGVAIAVLTVANLPGVYRRTVFPLATCLLLFGTLTVLAVNFASMAYWDAAAVELFNVLVWAFLLKVTLTAKAATAARRVNPAGPPAIALPARQGE
jgi:hypothetical protein